MESYETTWLVVKPGYKILSFAAHETLILGNAHVLIFFFCTRYNSLNCRYVEKALRRPGMLDIELERSMQESVGSYHWSLK